MNPEIYLDPREAALVRERRHRRLHVVVYPLARAAGMTLVLCGLAVTKQFVELHGGRIQVESREGSGATFHAALPLTPRA